MYTSILLPIDLEATDFSAPAIRQALELIEPYKGCLHLMAVIPGFNSPLVASYFDQKAVNRAHQSVDQHLRDYAASVIPEGIKYELSVHQGQIAERIVFQAERSSTQLIIMAAHHRGTIESVLLGSNTARVVEKSHCSVMVLREPLS